MGINAQTAKGELHRVGFTRDHTQLMANGLRHRAFGLPDFRQLARTTRKGRVTRNAHQILDRNRDALQRTEINPGGKGGVGCRRVATHLDFVPGLVGVEGFPTGVVIANGPIRQIACGKRVLTQCGDQIAQRCGANIRLFAHDPFSSMSRSVPPNDGGDQRAQIKRILVRK